MLVLPEMMLKCKASNLNIATRNKRTDRRTARGTEAIRHWLGLKKHVESILHSIDMEAGLCFWNDIMEQINDNQVFIIELIHFNYVVHIYLRLLM